MASPVLKGVKNILILALILAVPGFLYYLLTSKGKNHYKALPYFGEKKLSGTSHKVHGKVIPDTIYHTLPDFSLTDQESKKVTPATFDGKIFIANFFYTQCPNVCSLVNTYVDSLANSYAKNKMVKFVSITVNPQYDTPEVLKTYSAKMHTPAGKWLFLTGDTTSIYNLAHKGFLVDAGKLGDKFIYRDLLILIDSQKHIRGYYSGTNYAEVTRLDDEIKVLIAEELLKREKPLY